MTPAAQWKALTRNDWGEILALSERRSFQRKFQFVKGFTELVAEKGIHGVTYPEIARRCGTTRQLVTHHFPDHAQLLQLTYRFVYARFQKLASDALLARQGFAQQFIAYVDAVADWVEDYRADARFLAQWYATLQVGEELRELHERNMRIGQERIAALCLRAQKEERLFVGWSSEEALQRASSVQSQLIGYIITNSVRGPQARTSPARQELRRALLALLGFSAAPASAPPASRRF